MCLLIAVNPTANSAYTAPAMRYPDGATTPPKMNTSATKPAIPVSGAAEDIAKKTSALLPTAPARSSVGLSAGLSDAAGAGAFGVLAGKTVSLMALPTNHRVPETGDPGDGAHVPVQEHERACHDHRDRGDPGDAA